MSIVPGLESHIHMWVISIWYQTAKKIEQTSQLQTAVHYNYNREVGRLSTKLKSQFVINMPFMEYYFGSINELVGVVRRFTYTCQDKISVL